MPGSIRRDSINRRLAEALASMLSDRGVTTEVIDLADSPMPIYDGDAEAESGQPETAVELHGRLTSFDGLIFVSPEYNGGPSALLKNTIDWITRVDRAVFRQLLIGLATATPGGRGGISGLASMRTIIEHMRLDAAPDELSIPNAAAAFELVGERTVLARADDRERAAAYLDGYVDLLDDRRRQQLAG